MPSSYKRYCKTVLCAVSRSEKLKPFWLSISEEDLSVMHTISKAMLSRESSQEYREAVCRGLRIRGCKVVPFFGTFLQDLYGILTGIPGIVVFAQDNERPLDVRNVINNTHCGLVDFCNKVTRYEFMDICVKVFVLFYFFFAINI